jgi:hypothetical protein
MSDSPAVALRGGLPPSATGYMTTRSIPGATDNYAMGIAYVK